MNILNTLIKVSNICILSVLLLGCTVEKTEPLKNINLKEYENSELNTIQVPDEFKFKQGEAINYHSIQDNNLLLSLIDKSNRSIYETKALYSYDLKSHEVKEIELIDEKSRIWDFKFLNQDLVYSKVKFGDQDLIYEIIRVVDGKEVILDKGNIYSLFDAPILFETEDSLSYFSKSVQVANEKSKSGKYVLQFNKITDENVEVLWEKESAFENFIVDAKGEVAGMTRRSFSDTMITFITLKGNKSIVHYVIDDIVHEIEFPGSAIEAFPTENFILIKFSEKGENRVATSSYKLFNTINEQIIDVDLGEKSLSFGASLGHDALVYSDSARNSYVAQLNVDGVVEYTLNQTPKEVGYNEIMENGNLFVFRDTGYEIAFYELYK